MSDLAELPWCKLESRHLLDEKVPKRPLPEALTFVVEDPPTMEGPRMVFHGLLRNPADEEVVIVTADLGANACGFWVGFDEGAPVSYDGSRMPPGPPMPRQMKIPAQTAVRFRTGLDLWKYAYEGTPAVQVNWGFRLCGSRSLSGSLEVALPPRPERPKPVPGGPPMPS